MRQLMLCHWIPNAYLELSGDVDIGTSGRDGTDPFSRHVSAVTQHSQADCLTILDFLVGRKSEYLVCPTKQPFMAK